MSVKDKFFNQLNKQKTLIGGAAFLGMSRINDCPLCYTPMVSGERIVQLNCHVKHRMKEDCYQRLIDHYKSINQPASCPYCRAEIDQSKSIKILLKEDSVVKIKQGEELVEFGDTANNMSPSPNKNTMDHMHAPQGPHQNSQQSPRILAPILDAPDDVLVYDGNDP